MRIPQLAVRLATLLSLVFAVEAFAQSPSPSSPSPQIWIANVTITSPEDLDHIAAGSVLIENGRIVRIDRNPQAKPPKGATVISGKGQFLIPGLIDSHVHLASIPGMSSEQQRGKDKMIAAYRRQLPRSYLYYGYTTVVDLVVFDRQVLQDFRSAPLHPDLYDCGEAMPWANGYPMSFDPPEQRFKNFPNFLYDPAQASSFPAEFKPEDHSPAAAVTRVKKSGAICVKTFFERGFADNFKLPVITTAAFAEIRKAATDSGLLVMLHANSFEGQKLGAEGNADVIVHGMWHWRDHERVLDSEPKVPAEIKATLDQIIAKRIGYQPTFQVLEGERAYFEPGYLKSPDLAKVVPAEMLDWFNSDDGKWFGRLINEGKLPDEKFRRLFDEGPLRRVRQSTAYLAASNANFIFGTDTPSGPTYGNLPGFNGYLEMRQLLNAGLSLRQIFLAATLNNAVKMKLDAQLGTIEPGKSANLLLLTKSPLDTLDAYDSISAVILHGQIIARSSLSATAIP